MGNICDAIGLTRREPVKIENNKANSNSSSAGAGETKSPVVDAASPSSAPHANSSHTMNTVEMKVAFAKKQSDHAAAAAAIAVLSGPRIRLLPHQHTLFCERKQRVCAAVGEQQEMEVLVLEGLHTPTPPFSWIRISDIDAFNTAVVNGAVGPANYIVLEQEHALNERGVPAHSIFEYVLTREDVGHYIGVQYEDSTLVRASKSSTVKKATKNTVEVEERKSSEESKHTQEPIAATAAAAMVVGEDTAVDSDTAVRSTLDLMVNRVSLGDQEDKNNGGAESQSLPNPPAVSSSATVQPAEVQCEEKTAGDASVEVEVEGEGQQPLYRYLTLVSHGPVKPGPPRLTEFNISGSLQVGTMAVAEASYIGGYEGATEYWWMRISPEGKRTQVTEPCRVPYPATLTPLEDPAVLPVSSVAVPTTAAATPVPTDDSGALQMEAPEAAAAESKTAGAASSGAVVDPRYYFLTADDVGCSLKVKCRPTRSDGVEGEIFTSTSSEEVTSA